MFSRAAYAQSICLRCQLRTWPRPATTTATTRTLTPTRTALTATSRLAQRYSSTTSEATQEQAPVVPNEPAGASSKNVPPDNQEQQQQQPALPPDGPRPVPRALIDRVPGSTLASIKVIENLPSSQVAQSWQILPGAADDFLTYTPPPKIDETKKPGMVSERYLKPNPARAGSSPAILLGQGRHSAYEFFSFDAASASGTIPGQRTIPAKPVHNEPPPPMSESSGIWRRVDVITGDEAVEWTPKVASDPAVELEKTDDGTFTQQPRQNPNPLSPGYTEYLDFRRYHPRDDLLVRSSSLGLNVLGRPAEALVMRKYQYLKLGPGCGPPDVDEMTIFSKDNEYLDGFNNLDEVELATEYMANSALDYAEADTGADTNIDAMFDIRSDIDPDFDVEVSLEYFLVRKSKERMADKITASVEFHQTLTTLDESSNNIEELRPRPKESAGMSTHEFDKLYSMLFRSFTITQLQYYYHQALTADGSIASSDPELANIGRSTLGQQDTPVLAPAPQKPTHTRYRWILMQHPWNSTEASSYSASTTKQRLVMAILKDCWDLDTKDRMEGIGRLEIKISKKLLTLLLTGGESSLLNDLTTKYLDPGERIEAIKPKRRLVIIATRSKCETILERINEAVQRLVIKSFPLSYVNGLKLSPEQLEEMGNITNTIVYYASEKAEVRICWIDRDEYNISENVEKLDHVVFRLMYTALFGENPDPTPKLLAHPQKQKNGMFIKDYHVSSRHLTGWRNRMFSWSRWILPSTKQSSGSKEVVPGSKQVAYGSKPDKTLHPIADTLLPATEGSAAAEDQLIADSQTAHPWAPAHVTTKVTFGHILHSTRSSEQLKPMPDLVTSEHSRILSPVMPPPPVFHSLINTNLKPDRTTTILIRFYPDPEFVRQHSTKNFPLLEFRIRPRTKENPMPPPSAPVDPPAAPEPAPKPAPEPPVRKLLKNNPFADWLNEDKPKSEPKPEPKPKPAPEPNPELEAESEISTPLWHDSHKRLVAILRTHQRDLLLGHEVVDARFTQNIVSQFNTTELDKFEPMKAFYEASHIDLVSGRLQTPRRLNIELPVYLLSPSDKASSTHGENTDADAAAPDVAAPDVAAPDATAPDAAPAAEPAADSKDPEMLLSAYFFGGLELHQSMETRCGRNSMLRYTNTEAGQHGGRRAELSLALKTSRDSSSPITKPPRVSKDDQLVFLSTAYKVATGKAFAWSAQRS